MQHTCFWLYLRRIYETVLSRHLNENHSFTYCAIVRNEEEVFRMLHLIVNIINTILRTTVTVYNWMHLYNAYKKIAVNGNYKKFKNYIRKCHSFKFLQKVVFAFVTIEYNPTIMSRSNNHIRFGQLLRQWENKNDLSMKIISIECFPHLVTSSIVNSCAFKELSCLGVCRIWKFVGLHVGRLEILKISIAWDVSLWIILKCFPVYSVLMGMKYFLTYWIYVFKQGI